MRRLATCTHIPLRPWSTTTSTNTPRFTQYPPATLRTSRTTPTPFIIPQTQTHSYYTLSEDAREKLKRKTKKQFHFDPIPPPGVIAQEVYEKQQRLLEKKKRKLEKQKQKRLLKQHKLKLKLGHANANANHNYNGDVDEDDEDKMESLRQMASPFLLLCHPDKIASSSSNQDADNLAVAREVNLNAVQTLNMLIDAVEQTCQNLSLQDDQKQQRQHYKEQADDESVQAKKVHWPELKSSYTIEFMVPSSSNDNSSSNSKKMDQAGYTRRSVSLALQPSILRVVNVAKQHLPSSPQSSSSTTPTPFTVDGTTYHSTAQAALLLRRATMQEMTRLLHAAGCDIPPTLAAAMMQHHPENPNHLPPNKSKNPPLELTKQEAQHYQAAHALGLGPAYLRAKLANEPISMREHRRHAAYYYHASVDWQAQKEDYLYQKSQYEFDLATVGMTSEKAKRRIVAGVVGRMQIWKPPLDDEKKEKQGNEAVAAAAGGGLSLLDQLIASRRIFLLLHDHFDDLGMEDRGRLWENLTLVLKPHGDQHVLDHDSHGNGNRERWRRKGETGFTFALDRNDCVTVTVPSDFTDEVFLREVEFHLGQLNVDEW